jgi:hypothetical protein
MFAIGNTVVSEDLLEKNFICDLERCKGACCVKGDSGAPLEKKEAQMLEKIYPYIKPYLTGEGLNTIEEKGFYEMDSHGDFVTPLVGDQGPCAYAFYENGIAKCAIEKGYDEGMIEFRKPVSCHLYPVRVTRYDGYVAVNYHEWEICHAACMKGEAMKVPLFSFVKDALIRKFGEQWFEELCQTAEHYHSDKIRKEGN